MTKTFIAMATLALSLSAAGACEYQRSVQSEATDPTVVASIAADTSTMSAPAQPLLPAEINTAGSMEAK